MNARPTAVIAGLAAGAPFEAVLETDLRLTGNYVDDHFVLGCPFTRDPARARFVGAVFHEFNSVAMAGL